MRVKRLISGFAILALAACAAVGPASYGPADEKGFGYEETRIEANRFRIVYNGSGGMPPEIVEDYALRRAAELTLAEGFEWFRVIARDIAHDERGGVSIGAGFGTGSYGRRSSVGVGVGGNFGKVGAQDYFSVRLEVLMSDGETPEEGAAYNARSVLSSIGGE